MARKRSLSQQSAKAPEGSPRELLLAGYAELLDELKGRIRAAQLRAALAVNRELVLLYWHIGHDVLQRQQDAGWGAKVIDQLSADLRREFPELQGFSVRNLKYMRAFAEAWPKEPIVQEALAQITWYHNLALLEKLKDSGERLWYARQTIENGWSRNVLVYQIESQLFQRQGKAVTNFTRTLPSPQSELAQQLLKDPYHFDFLNLAKAAREHEIQQGLLKHLQQFLIELGVGFAFVGSNYHLEVGGQDYYLDLLFYHLRLRAFVVIDLKTGEFEPEFAGKMNFYLSAVDDLVRHATDQPSIGLILCKTKNKVVAEYALRDTSKPIGISEHKITASLPKKLQEELPTVAALEAELQAETREQEPSEKN